MRASTTVLTGCLAVFYTSAVIAQPPAMTELVPQNASFSLVFRNVSELKERGDEVSEELGYKSGFSMLFSMIGAQLLVTGAADDSQPCGVMWFEPELIGEPAVKQNWKNPVAAGVAISDTKKLAESLKVEHDDLLSGMVFEREHSAFGHKHRYYRIVDRYLWVVSHKNLYEVLENAKSLTHAIPGSRLEAINSADALVGIWGKARKLEREEAEKRAERWINSHKGLDAAELAALRELSSIISATSYGVGTVRIDRGIEASFDIFFDQETLQNLRPRILKFSPPADGVTLAGLPSGELLFGHAARTDAPGIQPVLTSIARENHSLWWPGWSRVQGKKFVSQLEQLKILGLFGEVWPLVNRYKVGLYRNADPAEQGLVTMAAILSTSNPQRLIQEIQTLAALVDRTAFGSPDNAADRSATEALVRRLITQLGDENFQQRQSATTRLVIIGEPALRQVGEAKLSDVPEVSRRAGEIQELIEKDLKDKREAALGSSVLAEAKPVFIFHPDAEERAGASVHIMEVRIQEGSELRPQLAFLAGEEWSRIRIVPMEGHVIVLFGSDRKLLDEMVDNVRRIELGEDVSVPETPSGQPLLTMRGAEFQGSVVRVNRLTNLKLLTEGEQGGNSDPELSSAAVTIEPEFFSVEWRLSLPDLIAIRKRAF